MNGVPKDGMRRRDAFALLCNTAQSNFLPDMSSVRFQADALKAINTM
jgi:hypothetical protein